MKQVLENVTEGRVALFISSPVLLEVEWVLRSVYQYTKQQIIEYLQAIIEFPNSEVMDRPVVTRAMQLYRQTSGVGFTDCLIICLAKHARVNNFLSNDRRLQKLYLSIR